MNNRPKILYLCCPYTHKDTAVREYRYKTSCRAAARLLQGGVLVFNPLSHSMPICEFLREAEKLSLEFWMRLDVPILEMCDELLVLGLDGWTESGGVTAEIFKAVILRKPITVIEEKDIDFLPSIPKSSCNFLKSEILKEAIE